MTADAIAHDPSVNMGRDAYYDIFWGEPQTFVVGDALAADRVDREMRTWGVAFVSSEPYKADQRARNTLLRAILDRLRPKVGT